MVITIDHDQIPQNDDLWLQVQQRFSTHDCTCGRYAFYYECGHIIGSPILFRCTGTIAIQTGKIILCYHPARLVNVFSVNIRGRCRDCT